MAQSLTDSTGTYIVPDSYADAKVAKSFSGLATNGVLLLIGEADVGVDFTQETDLAANSFSPTEDGQVLAKYKSGPLVDAFLAAVAASNDPDIAGSFNQIVLVKTNAATKALGTLSKIGGGSYASLYDRSSGALGNLIYFQVTQKTAEAVPTTGAFAYIPAVGTTALNFRVSGAAVAAPSNLSGNTSPPTFVSTVNALSGIAATGGAARTVIPGISGTLAVAVTDVTNKEIRITYSATWTTVPSVGDTLVIPNSSAIVGAANANIGAYIVNAATTNTITARKLSDAGNGAAVIGVVTAPAAVSATSVLATTDFTVYAPCTITLESTSVADGLGKTMEINELTGGTDLLSRSCFTVIGQAAQAVSWISKSGSPAIVNAAAEYQVNLNVNRQVDHISEVLSAGGDVGLKVGYTGTTASVVISDSIMTFTVTGGSGANLTVQLSSFPTINDLCAYINAFTGYSAAPGVSSMGSLPPSALDNGTFSCGTTFGAYTGRIKVDGYKFFKAVQGSALVQLGSPEAQSAQGLPDVNANYVFLAGGAKGATTDSNISAALTAAERVRCNFVIPLFSRDATYDIADGLTDTASTYTIDSTHAAVRTHCLKMSQIKRKRDRQGLLSFKGSFADSKTKAGNMASAIINMAFMDVKDVNSAGSVYQFQPWMGAVKAGALQAAGGYKPIFNKAVNCSGAIHAAGDYDDTMQEDALVAGLMPMTKREDGAIIFVSDQTTYAADDNFAYNSLQVMYTINEIKATCNQKMKKALVGQSTADISAGLALAGFQTCLDDLRANKRLAASDSAPAGYRKAKVLISGTGVFFSAEVIPANGIYFVRISFDVSPSVQSA